MSNTSNKPVMKISDPFDQLKLWPFEEARKIMRHLQHAPRDKSVLFETGYGPSGLPHIGTFGEVARTTWVKLAFEYVTGRKADILTFSDDMDALRKVPTNVPQQKMLQDHIGLPLTRIPDPFGKFESFAAHNNAMLCTFLDGFGFDYTFASATDYYKSGRFDAALRRMLEVHDAVVATIAPTLGPERRATYSPVLPIHPETGHVMQVPIIKVDPDAATVCWKDPATGRSYETSVLGGHAKMQWKADWAMRWYALGVDYEMSGKDLIESVKLSSKICRILGSQPPQTLTYELFLDQHAQKISKSKGNGLSIEEWLRYAPPESLAQFMFNQPTRAKRLFFDVIPRVMDEYINHADNLIAGPKEAQPTNPAWFVQGGAIQPDLTSPVSFGTLLNLASVANVDTSAPLWKFLQRYDESLSPETHPYVDRLISYALAYYRDFVKPNKHFRDPTDQERQALRDLATELSQADPSLTPLEVQDIVFAVGKRHPFANLREWFGCLYEVLLGQKEGPRFGIFAALLGLKETVTLIEDALSRPAKAIAPVTEV